MYNDWKPDEHIHYILTGIIGVDTIFNAKDENIKYVYRWICHAAHDVKMWKIREYKLIQYNPYSEERIDVTDQLEEELKN